MSSPRDPGQDDGEARAAEIAAALGRVRARIAGAAAAAGRRGEDVVLIGVTKTYPLADAALLAGLGVTDLGESRLQEALPKAAARPDLRWHFLGRIQRNKARDVGAIAALVHTFDRPELIAPLVRGAQRGSRGAVRVLVQVSLDGDPARGGALPVDVPALATEAAEAGLDVAGVMAIAPLEEEPMAAFGRLWGVASRLRGDFPGAAIMSAGMSGDLEAAIACGATHVRVGTALLGVRPPRGH